MPSRFYTGIPLIYSVLVATRRLQFDRDILHDPVTYEDPFAFRPERFIKDGKLDPTVQDPTDYMFGFGRRHAHLSSIYCSTMMTSANRICPGRYLAIPSLFINIASLLHVFDFSLPLDDSGQPVSAKYEEGHGLVRYVWA